MNSDPVIPIHELVYRSLRMRLMFGEIDPGTSFSIRKLATEFSVSMTPIREAIRRLAAEGVLQTSRSGRISVTLVNPDRLRELTSIRLLLESELAVRAIPRVHSKLTERLKRINLSVEEMIEKKNSMEFIKSNIQFHKILYLRAQAPTMLTLLETVWLQLGPTLKIASRKYFEVANVSYHHEILEALSNFNSQNLVRSIKSDINNDLKILIN